MTEQPHRGPVPGPAPVSDPQLRARREAYWRRNIRYVLVLIAIWFVVSYGFGILLAEPLNRLRIPGTGFPAGFWFAQQGAVYVFVALIFIYARLMNRLDREFDVDEGDGAAPHHLRRPRGPRRGAHEPGREGRREPGPGGAS